MECVLPSTDRAEVRPEGLPRRECINTFVTERAGTRFLLAWIDYNSVSGAADGRDENSMSNSVKQCQIVPFCFSMSLKKMRRRPVPKQEMKNNEWSQ